MNPTNVTNTGQTSLKTSRGVLNSLIVNKIPGGGLKLYDSATTSGAPTGTLLATLSTTASTGTYAYKCRLLNGLYVLNGDAVRATQTLTSDATNVADADTVTIGTTVYRFKDTMAAAYDVKRGADAATSLDNLKAAINASGTAGTEYFAGTLAHPTVTATTNTDTTQVVQAIAYGTGPNAIATTETSAHLSWGAATLASGSEGTAFDVTVVWE